MRLRQFSAGLKRRRAGAAGELGLERAARHCWKVVELGEGSFPLVEVRGCHGRTIAGFKQNRDSITDPERAFVTEDFMTVRAVVAGRQGDPSGVDDVFSRAFLLLGIQAPDVAVGAR